MTPSSIDVAFLAYNPLPWHSFAFLYQVLQLGCNGLAVEPINRHCMLYTKVCKHTKRLPALLIGAVPSKGIHYCYRIVLLDEPLPHCIPLSI